MSPNNKVEKKEDTIFVNIYGKSYDLTKFSKKHPGGSDMLIMANNTKDATPMFETYHA